ncbi:ABC transporter substrate-binding protein [Castellaniella sp.]|uniref:ABC transporter substrate-binding protein n=1 Tax=Castellaniella sp. TaxID=1955812 RepID=UPI0025BE3020|nr:ABC transporter substrate-binding protein [Castellaniella sp.]
MNDKIISVNRRQLLQLLAGGGAGLALSGLPGIAAASGRKETLVIGLDISDTITLDPGRQAQYTPPLTLLAAYDMLDTMNPGNYTAVVPALATSWARTSDGKGWRLSIRQGVKFATGNVMTVDDVVWSFERLRGLNDQPWLYLKNIEAVTAVDDKTIDVLLKDPAAPIMDLLASPTWAIYERKVLEKHGGVGGAGDKATDWLNGHSCGTGAYSVAAWERNVQIQLVQNPHYWRGKPGFQRIVIRHLPDSAAQLLAVERGDVDVAFNLLPEQIGGLKNNSKVRIEKLPSLDFIYMAVTQNPEFNKALAIKEARQAIGYSIDYDGIKNGLLGGYAQRPASFLPIGVIGSTEEIARKIGFRQDLDHAKELLKKAGLPNGFEFDLSYGNATIAGVSYQILGQKIQSDLARVGIKVNLKPVDQVNLRTAYTTGKSTAVLTFWNPPAVADELWAQATVGRVAKRVHWTPPQELQDLVRRATVEADPAKQSDLWVEYQKQMVDQANLVILFQPIYRIAVRNDVKSFPLTAAGWQADLRNAHR